MRMTIDEAKERLRIPELWNRFGFPGEPKKSCKSPFRDDRGPSFSVFNDGQAWKDFGTGEGGDAITFLSFASGLEPKEATKKFIEMAGGEIYFPTPVIPKPKPKKEEAERPLPTLPELRNGTEKEYWQLERLRKIGADILKIAHKRGFLFFGNAYGFPSWIVTDRTRRNAQPRRLDGEKWRTHNAESKVIGFKGNDGKWLLGAEESLPSPTIALVEGGGDLLASFQYLWAESRLKDVAPVAMLGASMPIHEDALPLFAGKRIRIFPHLDPEGQGQEAAQTWAWQLKRAGAGKVDAFNFEGFRMTNGEPVKDLNDMTSIDADSYEDLQHDLMP